MNGLRNDPELGITKEAVEAALTEMGLPTTVRGETLSLVQFAELSDRLQP